MITPDKEYFKRINFSQEPKVCIISTPEKNKESRENKENTNTMNIQHLQPNMPFTSTYDKTRSGNKKNCFMCRIKPLSTITELVDIDDPNMLDKIDNKPNRLCVCESPMLEYMKDTRQENSYASKNFYNMDYTPNRYLPTFSTPAYLKHSYNLNSSDGKMNNTKYILLNIVYIKYSSLIYY